MADVTEAQTTALVVVPKFAAAASIVGSFLILRDVLKLYTKSRRRPASNNRASSRSITHDHNSNFTTRHRLLAGMSLCDLMSSLAWFMTSWPIPKWVFWTKWNVGNVKSCSAQGFFVQWAIGTVSYNACLAIYYLLVIRYGVRNEIMERKIEPIMHLVAIGFAAATSITLLAKGLFNPQGWKCHINANPPWCTQSYEGKGLTNCVRGDNARLYSLAFWHVPAWFIMMILTVCMMLIFCKIRTVENNILHHAANPGRLQRRFAWGAIAYVGAMFVSWSIATGVYIYWEVTGGERVNWWLSFWAAVLLPSQGASNCLIYFSSALSSQRREQRRSTSSDLLSDEFSGDLLSRLCCFRSSDARSAGTGSSWGLRLNSRTATRGNSSSNALFARMSRRKTEEEGGEEADAANEEMEDKDPVVLIDGQESQPKNDSNGVVGDAVRSNETALEDVSGDRGTEETAATATTATAEETEP